VTCMLTRSRLAITTHGPFSSLARTMTNAVRTLSDYLDSLGLSGSYWILNDQRLVEALSHRFPDRVRAAPSPKSVLQPCDCSVLIAGSPESSTDLPALAKAAHRPLIVTLGPVEPTGTTARSLASLGYRLPAVKVAPGLFALFPAALEHKRFFDVARYWEQRYGSGRNSGSGSYGRLARFKAHIINRFVHDHSIQSVIELGCGDGAQLSLADYPRYVGLDISPTAVETCRQTFADDTTKTFHVYFPDQFDPRQFSCELGLSLDVLFHLSHDELYRTYLAHLFAASERFVIIYANVDSRTRYGVSEEATYMRFRDVYHDISSWHRDWHLVEAIPNWYPYSAQNPNDTSVADFLVFSRRPGPIALPHGVTERFLTEKALNALAVADENAARSVNVLRSLHRKVDDLATHLTNVDRRVAEDRERVARDLAARDTTIAQLRASLQERGDFLIQLQRTVSEREAEFVRLQTALSERQSEVLALRSETDSLRATLREREEALEDLRARLADSEALAADLKAELERKTAFIEHLQSSLPKGAGPQSRSVLDTLQAQLRDRDSEIVSLQSSVDELRIQLENALTTKHRIANEHRQVLARYRQANARYRVTCQSLSALKASRTYRAGQYLRAASRSPLDAIKLPLRLWRLRSRATQPSWRNRSAQFLRTLKWRVVVPSARWLGFSYGSVARLRLPRFLRDGSGTGSSPDMAEERTPSSEGSFPIPSAAVQEATLIGWPAPPNDSRPLVMAVVDEFTEHCLGFDLRLLQPRPDNWYALANRYRPILVFIESAWMGNGGSWQYRVGTYNVSPGNELAHMTTWARQTGIPSVFWNKEDPVHHERFLAAARLVDHIFTTDVRLIDEYKTQTGRSSVHPLPFAAQPRLHRPRPLATRHPRAFFAGSWYHGRHDARGQSMTWLLGAALQEGVDIFDRNGGAGHFTFPDAYRGRIVGTLAYPELCRAYGRYRVGLNVNSVSDSPTMFSRRVFELMACGTPIVSTYARGIEDTFSSDAVWLVRTEDEAREAIRTLLTDDREWRRRSLAGIREIFTAHTYAHRLAEVFRILGLTPPFVMSPRLLVCARVRHASDLPRLLQFVERQHYRSFHCLVEWLDAEPPARRYAQVDLLPAGALDVTLRATLDGSYAACGWVSPRHEYGPHYLRDLANAMLYAPDVDGWAKACASDAFDTGHRTWLSASLWRPDVFLSRWISAPADVAIQDARLFCIDTEEFTATD
jgi:SAM-dependent methyltransferase